MTSHIHVIMSSNGEKLGYIKQDMKKFTSRKLIRAIKEITENRRKWMIERFEAAAGRIKRGKYHRVWQNGFRPVELNSNKMQEERLEYVHNNPVVEGL